MAANSNVTSNVLVNGPLGIGLLSINNNSATYLQDDANARTLANGVKFTGCNDITFNIAGNGSLTFEPSGTTPTTFALPGGNRPGDQQHPHHRRGHHRPSRPVRERRRHRSSAPTIPIPAPIISSKP